MRVDHDEIFTEDGVFVGLYEDKELAGNILSCRKVGFVAFVQVVFDVLGGFHRGFDCFDTEIGKV